MFLKSNLAPGVNIIAAWPQNLGPIALPEDSRRVNFTVMSGTSMACPHTPAAIKSAIMTTAKITDHSGRTIMDEDKPTGVFATGAGHVNPKRAINLGLVYDIRPDKYFTHLCTLGYTKSEIFTITHRNVSCHETLLENRGFSINYPSISVMFTSRKMSKVIKRQLTNVASPNSIYSVEVVEPFLTSSVPNLSFDDLVINVEAFGSELNPNSGFGFQIKFVP
ncbi:subtilisin-like protease SBT1.2, partial [Camellia sinensis]|uniref:subtilisin-like protease SBT1.2 n=1 Tax=Camellia sinensis TaxID=4442 RepID=UPI0010364604